MSLISASGEEARAATLNALDGALSREIGECRDELARTAAFLAAWVDYPDDEIEELFKKKYRDIDILIIDDIQFLGTAPKTQTEFFHTFESLFGDKKQMGDMDSIKAINTEAPIVFDKLQQYKKEIFNEALTFLGINNIMLEKAERLITDEANSNNELINLNLQSFLAPRLEACRQFNEKFHLTGTDKEISVRVRSDLYNVIKKEMSITKDFTTNEEQEKIDEDIKEGEE